MREYSTPLTVTIPSSGNLTDDVVRRASEGPDQVAFSIRGDRGWQDVTIGRFHVRGRESGAGTESPWAAVVHFKGSKGIRIRSYFNVEEALEAAGLSE